MQTFLIYPRVTTNLVGYFIGAKSEADARIMCERATTHAKAATRQDEYDCVPVKRVPPPEGVVHGTDDQVFSAQPNAVKLR